MNYINDFHWIWYGIGFALAPRLTIMIMLTIHFSWLIPLPLLVIGWVYAILGGISISFGGKNNNA